MYRNNIGWIANRESLSVGACLAYQTVIPARTHGTQPLRNLREKDKCATRVARCMEIRVSTNNFERGIDDLIWGRGFR
jgi:hypothetical protein